MPRITVRVDDETEEWLESEAARLDRSKAWTGGQCIELLRDASDNHINPQQFDAATDIDLMHADAERVDEVEERLAEVESRVKALEAEEHTHADASVSADGADDESPTNEQESLSTQTAASQHTPDAGGSEDGSVSVDESADSLRAEAEAAAQAADIPGRPEATRAARQDGLLFAWEYLREQERAQSSEIANAVFDQFDEDDLGYSAQDKYRGRGLWQGYLRDALRELPGVDGPGERGRTWEFVES